MKGFAMAIFLLALPGCRLIRHEANRHIAKIADEQYQENIEFEWKTDLKDACDEVLVGDCNAGR